MELWKQDNRGSNLMKFVVVLFTHNQTYTYVLSPLGFVKITYKLRIKKPNPETQPLKFLATLLICDVASLSNYVLLNSHSISLQKILQYCINS